MKLSPVLRFLLAASLLFFGFGERSYAQEGRTDTLRLDVFFQRGISGIDPGFRDNGARMRDFRKSIETRQREGCAVETVLLSGSASPEGSFSENKVIAGLRAHALDTWLTDTLGLRSARYYSEVGENWEGLASILRTLDVPWYKAALEIIEDDIAVEEREKRLRRLEGGEVWRWLEANVFPDLRTGVVSVEWIVALPQPALPDTVFVMQTVRDTVYLDDTPVPSSFGVDRRIPDFSDRRLLLALRTNMFAIPFMNLGVEVPLGRRWSVGADIYYPWLERPGHAGGVDMTGVCNELAAADVEVRYWFPRKDMQGGQRLLGHSIGLYGAAGYYDFERDWSGHQGDFFNIGLDYLYAAPIFRGRMHLEAELGLGYIRSTARPYDCFEPGGVIYHRKGVTQNTTWVGPTRVQVSLVFPIYTRRKGGER
jgi:hypothetical protein